MRQNKALYDNLYAKVIEMHKSGKSIKEISEELSISYSAVYAWVKELRKPKESRLSEFLNYIKQNGPAPVAEIKQKFEKHNELYNQAKAQNLDIERFILSMPQKWKGYSTWYFTKDQKEKLNVIINAFLKKFEVGSQKFLEKIKS